MPSCVVVRPVMSCHVSCPVMLPCYVICLVIIAAFNVMLYMLISFRMILMYFSQANKAPVRSLDACLGEGVMAFMPAPPFFPSGRLAGHRSPLSTLN